MKTILLYGELRKKFGKLHRFKVRNAQEAIRALKANFRDFAPYMHNAHKSGTGFRVFVGDRSLGDYKDLADPSGNSETIRIVPTIIGSGAVGRILLGALLIIAGVLVTGLSFGGAAPLGGAMISAGASLILSGVSELLASPPDKPEEKKTSSYVFSGAENVAVQGTAVPMIYGLMICGSAVISAGIDTHEEPI